MASQHKPLSGYSSPSAPQSPTDSSSSLPTLPAHSSSTVPIPTRSRPSNEIDIPIGSPSPGSRSVILPRRPRQESISTLRAEPSVNSPPVARVFSNPLPQAFPSLKFTRSRASSTDHNSRSLSRERAFSWSKSIRSPTPPNGAPQSWYNSHSTASSRPWVEKRRKTVPVEQTEGWINAREHVSKAVVNVLGVAKEVVHESLILSAELLEFAPLPGLAVAARSLLDIWEALQQVDVNRSACLRLTERCATILFSIREEIAEAGDQVGEELLHPIQQLVNAFIQARGFMQKQGHRPFLKRYLKRDEIQREIQICDNSLNDALNMFSLSIQIRILKQVLQAERQRQQDTAHILEHVSNLPQVPREQPLPDAGSLRLAIEGPPPTTSLDQLLHASPEQIRHTLGALLAQQNERDQASDTEDIRQLMRNALQANSDVEMLGVLQVGRDEMPEAIKALQRALEAEIDREAAEAEAENADTVLVASISSAVSNTGGVADTSAGSNLTRSRTIASVESRRSSVDGSTSSKRRTRDTLDREFIESGIDAMRRLSTVEVTLPNWTITRYEVDREEKIGIGFYSDVYKGTWRDRTVAIKILADCTPRQLFVHEATIWKSLQHPNVLELLGASSASSEPPWFFVSPYMKNGSLISYLKNLPSLDSVDSLKMIHEISKGMAYLHSKDVLHGDLKGANVLVDDHGHCVISDFGQSEMKQEVYRISGEMPPHGTLRWLAPELLMGQSGMTQQVDVYAFAMCCIEVLAKGGLPWPMVDDDTVRHFVMKENMRPPIPTVNQKWSPALAKIIDACWETSPTARPSFSKVVQDIQRLRHTLGLDVKDSPLLKPQLDHPHHQKPSPDMHPQDLPPVAPDTTVTFYDDVPSESSYWTAENTLESIQPQLSGTARDASVGYIASRPETHRSLSVDTETSTSNSAAASVIVIDRDGYQSPPPADEIQAEFRNERRYRMLLQHEYHPSLTLPLWTPSHIALGAVGYLLRPSGEFVTLFNAFKPLDSSGGRTGNMASLEGYGRVSMGMQKGDKRNVAQRGMDMIQSWLTSRAAAAAASTVSRRYSSPLRAGHKAAHLFAESTAYRYVEDLQTPKRWFKANVDAILAIYGAEHRITREDLYLVIGTLEAQDYALYVSHSHPDGQINFNVHSSARAGQQWGHFSTTTDLSSSHIGGPVYTDEPVGSELSANKVSTVGRGGKWDVVLVARLRFRTDSADPTAQ